MKRYAFIPVVAAFTLAGCTQQLWVMDDKDHALLTETRDMAQQAKTASDAAAQDSKAARSAAEQALSVANKAEADAQAASAKADSASDKADKMFQQSQDK